MNIPFMKISIITANYNYAKYLEEMINSVINQSYADWELIIVDDGSSDNSVEIIKSYCEKDGRIKLFQHPDGKNKGLKESLLLGLSHCSGEWVAFLESDDYFHPENLSKKVEIIKKYPDANLTNISLIFNRVEFIKTEEKSAKNIKIFEKTQERLSKINFPRNMFFDFYINNMILTFSCVMVKADALRNADFNTPLDTMLDWWLWIHLAYKNKFYYTDEALTCWRLHDESYLLRGKKPVLCPVQVQAYFDIYKKTEKPLFMLIFMLYSSVILIFVRAYRFIRRKIRTNL